MKITHDESVDALYIELTKHLPISTRRITADFILHIDEYDRVAGIEILNAQAVGVDALNIMIERYSKTQRAEHPDPEAIKQRRLAIAEARKRKREREKAQDTS
mgnify:CR=1 FL=1